MPWFKKKLGDSLVSAGTITEAQLEQAIKIQQEKGGRLGEILIQLGFLTTITLAKAIAEQLGIPFIDLAHYTINPEVVQKLPERIARKYRALVLEVLAEGYLVGMCDPTDLSAYDQLTRLLKGKVLLAIVVEKDLVRVADLVYRRIKDITSFAVELKNEIAKTAPKGETLEPVAADSAPVIRMLDSIFEDAVQMNASDIHIEPDETFLRIRLRIDGVLHENIVHAKEIISALVLRIKLMANLNISEKRIAQDGRFRITVKAHNIDVRVSTMPVRYGESVVMRLLDQGTGILTLEQLGMPKDILEDVLTLIHKPYGMLLVTGPTGSGKTTTLYAILDKLNRPENKIITIEDPVEYALPRLNQVQVNPEIDFNFSTVLRSALRQDPDIIMVGEMRDEETARIGLRAALTGHLVFSTLHTNDSISTAIRLTDMGAEGYLVAGALMGIIAQRLVRKICSGCEEYYQPTYKEQILVRELFGEYENKTFFKRGVGCSRCNRTGFRGRIGVYELLKMKKELADALRSNDTIAFMNLARKQVHFKTLAQCAFQYALQGMTTLAEVFKLLEAVG
jgi:MSHA biogenesis protein MshE